MLYNLYAYIVDYWPSAYSSYATRKQPQNFLPDKRGVRCFSGILFSSHEGEYEKTALNLTYNNPMFNRFETRVRNTWTASSGIDREFQHLLTHVNAVEPLDPATI